LKFELSKPLIPKRLQLYFRHFTPKPNTTQLYAFAMSFYALSVLFYALGVPFCALSVLFYALGVLFYALGVLFYALGVPFYALSYFQNPPSQSKKPHQMPHNPFSPFQTSFLTLLLKTQNSPFSHKPPFSAHFLSIRAKSRMSAYYVLVLNFAQSLFLRLSSQIMLTCPSKHVNYKSTFFV